MKMHTNRRQEAKLLPPDTFLSRKNAFAGGATALPQIPQLVMGEGPREGEGKGKEGEGRGGREGRGVEGTGRGSAIRPE